LFAGRIGLRFAADKIEGQSVDFEDNGIIALNRADFTKNAKRRVRTGIAKSQKIPRRAMRIIEPRCHQHRALEDDALAIFAGADSTQ
jgi:hypothetical protein